MGQNNCLVIMLVTLSLHVTTLYSLDTVSWYTLPHWTFQVEPRTTGIITCMLQIGNCGSKRSSDSARHGTLRNMHKGIGGVVYVWLVPIPSVYDSNTLPFP